MKMLRMLKITAYRALEHIDGEKHYFTLLSYKKAQLLKWQILTKLNL